MIKKIKNLALFLLKVRLLIIPPVALYALVNYLRKKD